MRIVPEGGTWVKTTRELSSAVFGFMVVWYCENTMNGFGTT